MAKPRPFRRLTNPILNHLQDAVDYLRIPDYQTYAIPDDPDTPAPPTRYPGSLYVSCNSPQ